MKKITKKQKYIVSAVLVSLALILGTSWYVLRVLPVQEPRDLSEEEKSFVWEVDFGTEVPTAQDSYIRYSFDELVYGEKSTAEYVLEVAWLPEPVATTFEAVGHTASEIFPSIYHVGTIKNGTLAGAELYRVMASEMGDWESLYALRGTQEIIEVTKWIPDVSSLPKTIRAIVGNTNLIRKEHVSGASFPRLREMSKQSESPLISRAVYADDGIVNNEVHQYQQCLFARTPGDMIVEYVVDVPFIDDSLEGGYGTPSITLTKNNGVRTTAEYEIYDRVDYGCGSLCSPLKVTDRTDDAFIPIGTADSGDVLYALKDTRDPLLVQLYEQPNTRAFIDTSDGRYNPLSKNKYSYEEFIAMNPLVFWKDTLGRWVRFVHSEFLILAEKCKPVIYLYPTEPTDMHVEVAPNIGFTKTIPEYKNGWDVTAYPDGTVVERTTKKEYPYLYWAGLVAQYPLIESGFVVQQKDLDTFFDIYLARYGLIGKEIEDFKEYWEDDLRDAPYYAISFVDQETIDELSPLSLDVKPDTLIRVLMTAMPLTRPIELPRPRLKPTPVRHGFTVAEWGGTVLREGGVQIVE